MAEKTDTKSKILEVAARLFHEQGYHATGIATILREAEVNSGSLYHFFSSKEALLIGVLEQYVQWLEPVVLAPAEQVSEDPIERVFALLAWYRLGLTMSECTLGCPIGNLALELGDSNPQARDLIHLNFENWAKGVARWLEAAGDRLPSFVDRVQLARFVLTTMEGGVMQARAAGSIRAYDDAVEQLRGYFGALEQSARSLRDSGDSDERNGHAAGD